MPPISTAPDVLQQLRHATAQRHQVLDTAMPLADPAATLADYRHHLQLLRAWLAPLSRALAAHADGPQDPRLLPPHDYLAAIETDLAHSALADIDNGAAAATVDTLADGAAPAWPAHADPAYRWGVCYVLEGSQLGGAVLYKRLAAQLAPHPLAYLQGAEGGPGPRWKGFMAALRAAVTAPDQVARACQGACDAFDRLIALRAQPEHGHGHGVSS